MKHDGSRMPFDGFYQVPLTEKGPIYTEVQPMMSNYRVPLFVQRAIQEVQQSEILDFSFFNIENVRGYYKIDRDGKKIRLVNAEDIARGAGIVQHKSFPTSGEMDEFPIYATQCEYIRWERVNEYAQSRMPYLLQYLPRSILCYIPEKLDRESYIPIELAVQIIMCADSEKAKKFQALVSIKIAAEIDRRLDEKYSEELNRLKGWKEDAKESVNKDIATLKDMVYMGASIERLREAIREMDFL